MLNFFKKKYIVSIKHVCFKSISKSYVLNDKDDLNNFLVRCYALNNYKTVLNIKASDFDVNELVELYNLNPHNEKKVDISSILVDGSKDFLKKHDLNNYNVEYKMTIQPYDFESDFVILLLDEENEIKEECHIPNYEELKKFIKDMINHNINHMYTVNPEALTVKEYLELLNLYDKFKPFEGFKTAYEINQYILDGRILSEFEPVIVKKEIVEIT